MCTGHYIRCRLGFGINTRNFFTVRGAEKKEWRMEKAAVGLQRRFDWEESDDVGLGRGVWAKVDGSREKNSFPTLAQW